MDWPDWWSWDLELSSHLLKRMVDRDFTEGDLRTMLVDASGFRPDYEPKRWVIETRHYGRSWEIIVEPDRSERVLVVVTGYPIEE